MHSPAAPSPPTPRQIDDALAVVHSPGLVHNMPALRANAWETLMRVRGRSMDRTRIGRLQEMQRQAHLRVVASEAITQAICILHTRHRPADLFGADRFADDVHADLGGAA